jgi:hypothetical protein
VEKCNKQKSILKINEQKKITRKRGTNGGGDDKRQQ